MAHEITVRADGRAEAALRVSEAGERARREELETLMDALPVAVIFSHDPGSPQMTGNRAAMQLFRLSQQPNPETGLGLMEKDDTFDFWSNGRCLEPHEWPTMRAMAGGLASDPAYAALLAWTPAAAWALARPWP